MRRYLRRLGRYLPSGESSDGQDPSTEVLSDVLETGDSPSPTREKRRYTPVRKLKRSATATPRPISSSSSPRLPDIDSKRKRLSSAPYEMMSEEDSTARLSRRSSVLVRDICVHCLIMQEIRNKAKCFAGWSYCVVSSFQQHWITRTKISPDTANRRQRVHICKKNEIILKIFQWFGWERRRWRGPGNNVQGTSSGNNSEKEGGHRKGAITIYFII